MNDDRLIFELSAPGRGTGFFPKSDVPETPLAGAVPPSMLRGDAPALPQASQADVARHYTGLLQTNRAADSEFSPHRPCAEEYNPEISEDAAALPGFLKAHPLAGDDAVQGCLALLYRMDKMLSEITGMARVTMQPAGADGALTGLMILRAYHESRGDAKRRRLLVPDAAHGTVAASCAAVGLKAVEIQTDPEGNVDLKSLKSAVGGDTAGLMLQGPNICGPFDPHIQEITEIVHGAGGLCCCDGACKNAAAGVSRPGELGFDIALVSLWGAGPVGVTKELVRFLPRPVVECASGRYFTDYDRPDSIGRVKPFYGSFGDAVRAYASILTYGAQGIRCAAENGPSPVISAPQGTHAASEPALTYAQALAARQKG